MVSVRLPDRAMYPQFTKFVKTEIPKVPNKPKVWRAFLKYGEYSTRWLGKKWATFAMSWGTAPDIVIHDLPPGQDGKFHARLGKNNIFIARVLADRFEIDYRNPHARKMIEATILHEMVHWADYHDGKFQLRRLGKEAGWEFEKEAYDTLARRWWFPGS